ncbi:exodeoxyribonuclease V subunit beta [Enterobacteriaceae endosymbiont of Macroplea appendiculata]|uniref:exodeoxyribonuclease V subunit beta n=1 Tax=Enterobacteriaceae endosymbiont of Macroplea appendiculata TaxID=2675790 RepID=UPI001449DA09|nr:exodeoxyribonuclease V subunit beta [Enterobacteriaceae endosymbiont of Macroplea appendiculata]QJC30997.1 exodeoxyribonuclease V subunit beta [Enterobacteriaceae endosymbiont of Macroplea appendiculata]
MKLPILLTQEFNPYKIHLQGQYLIEASAGTGKTFTIIIVYLRLLLGLYKPKLYSIPLTVQNILVVTFTEIAACDLYKKIVHSIQILLRACINRSSKYQMINILLSEIKDLIQAQKILLQATKNIHKASIYTIHSFCQKILNFKSYDITHNVITIMNNELELYWINQAITQFWNEHIQSLPMHIVKIFFQKFQTPKNLLQSILPFFFHYKNSNIKFNIHNVNFTQQFQKNINYINIIKKTWQLYYKNILHIIHDSDINKYLYNKRSLMNWITEINIWTITNTLDNSYPIKLKKFSQKNLILHSIKYPPKHILFTKIDVFLNKIVSLKHLILFQVVKYVYNFLKIKKTKTKKISFDDLLNILLKRLNSTLGISIAQDIQKQYPVVLLDEFQDTSIEQYNIFQTIYLNNIHNSLIIYIGDPKQSIYAFRNADVFTYLRAKQKIQYCYTLQYNWRSSSTMTNSINNLFMNRSNPFLLKNIHFQPLKYAQEKYNYNLIINDKIQPGITFWFDLHEYNNMCFKQKIAYICAENIYTTLLHDNYIILNKKKRKIHITDIVIIVRNKYEAYIIQKELIKFNILSIYLSEQNNIFQNIEAKELVLLLKAIAEPYDIKSVMHILNHSLFTTSLQNFDVNNKNNFLLKIMRQFSIYKEMWQQKGILYMLKYFFLKENILKKINIICLYNEQQIKNILFIGEYIQTKFKKTTHIKILIQWITKQIIYPNSKNIVCLPKQYDENNHIRIMTIHQSKGLQFNIVWLPFIVCNFIDVMNSEVIVYHDPITYKKNIDFHKNQENIQYALQESLSENLRLLYVSITRSIFTCNIGLANIQFYQYNKYHKYIKYFNSLQYLLKNKNNDKNILYNNIKQLITNDIKIVILNYKMFIVNKISKPHILIYQYDVLEQKNNLNKFNTIKIMNFTKIKQIQYKNKIYIKPIDTFYFLQTQKKYIKKTQHNFLVGKKIGIFMHKILEKVTIKYSNIHDIIKKELFKNNIHISWHKMLTNWINNIINTPLGPQKIILKQIVKEHKQVEFEFYCTIKNNIYDIQFNDIIKKYDIISSNLSTICFPDFKGFLNGILDLVCIWQDKYYIIDYKTTWLGYNINYYNYKNIETDICRNRYDIQYQLYTLALHKYLKNNMYNYNYSKHFGAVIYLYLRGINNNMKNKHGIWLHKPSVELIQKLDLLFN